MIEYVAGVIDARGHIECMTRHGLPTARIRVTTRRRELIDYLAKLGGGTVRADEREYRRRACSEHCQDQHMHVQRQSAYWDVTGSRAVVILYNVLPHLVDHRADAHRALENGAAGWPTHRPRTEVTADLAQRGWAIPTRADLPVCSTRTKSARLSPVRETA